MKKLSVLLFMVILSINISYAAEIFIAPNGNDSTGSGTISLPYKTIQYVLDTISKAGDVITLRNGTYSEAIRVRKPNMTIQSKEGELAKISIPPTIASDGKSTVHFDVDSKGGRLSRIEVTGGFYGIKFESQWSYDSTPLDNKYATHITIEDCIIHDTGRDAIKLSAGNDDITIRRCEIYNTGAGYPEGTPLDSKNAEGIDVVNSDRLLVQDCYIHDVASCGVYFKGGSTEGVIERVKVVTSALGIAVGQDTSPSSFDLSVNPDYYENIRGTVRNCVVMNTRYAGIALYASKDAKIYNNTIVNTAIQEQSPILFGITFQDSDPNAKRPANLNPLIMNNIIFQSETSRSDCVTIRYSSELGGISGLSGKPVMDNNCYYKAGGACVFKDNRPTSQLSSGSLSQWRTHISGEYSSLETNPLMDDNYRLTSTSPCIDKGNNNIPGGISETDKDGNIRIINSVVDMGAYEFANSGTTSSTTPSTTSTAPTTTSTILTTTTTKPTTTTTSTISTTSTTTTSLATTTTTTTTLPPVQGDVNGNRMLELDDVIASLQIIAGLSTKKTVISSDVNKDGKIGIEEAIFLLQTITKKP